MNHFSEEELSCPCCGKNGFKPDTLKKFNALREDCGFPLRMNSGYRCENYNTTKGYTQTHATGQAGDISVTHEQAYVVMEKAPKHGFTGVGFNQKGTPDQRFIHLDDLPRTSLRPRPHIWSY